MRQLVVLGATGSVGRNTLDVVARHPGRLGVLALAAQRDVDGLFALCQQFRPRYAALADVAAAMRLRERCDQARLAVEVLGGAEAVCDLARLDEADLVMSAISGSPGLLPTCAAVEAGKTVLIANKEPLVMAGRLLMQRAARAGATLLPIDSEHNAIFQCLPGGYRCGAAPAGVRKLILTASGGPFRELPLERFAAITPEQALRHPNWTMGPKISVDSATMMNKGLELVEAQVLYGLPAAQLEVVIHPESAVHSLVEYVDGSLLAQLGSADMRVPIAHALAWPERWESGAARLDLAALARMHFSAPDLQRFPCLRLARQALEAGGGMPLVLNAANEIAVEAFLNGQLRFTAIPDMIEHSLAALSGATLPDSLDGILALDAQAREQARRRLPGSAA
ncbi:MAG: 1-deoxy-D-xylulose-5-phosphate reductoisomerase [Gammaproteobacteria bacterium]